MGVLLKHLGDNERALDYSQQALKVYERVLGKTPPDTLMAIMNLRGHIQGGGGLCEGSGDVKALTGWIREDTWEGTKGNKSTY